MRGCRLRVVAFMLGLVVCLQRGLTTAAPVATDAKDLIRHELELAARSIGEPPTSASEYELHDFPYDGTVYCHAEHPARSGAAAATVGGPKAASAVHYSVIMPFYNVKANIFNVSLSSVLESALQMSALNGTVCGEVVIVDDASSEEFSAHLFRMVKHVSPLVSAFVRFRIVKLKKNIGQSAGRNVGVAASLGEAIMYCDADDRFLESHIRICHRFVFLQRSHGYLRTLIIQNNGIHYDWVERLSGTLPLTMCVRRAEHFFVGGFPHSQTFRHHFEDVYYEMALSAYTEAFKLPLATVEYMMYEGNNFDAQLAKFRRGHRDQPVEDLSQKTEEERELPFHCFMNSADALITHSKSIKEGKVDSSTIHQLNSISRQVEVITDTCVRILLVWHPHEALHCLLRVLQLDPAVPVVYSAIAETLGEWERWEESTVLLRTALLLDPDSAVLHSRYAVSLVNQGIHGTGINLGLYQEALREQKRAFALDSTNYDVLIQGRMLREGLVSRTNEEESRAMITRDYAFLDDPPAVESAA